MKAFSNIGYKDEDIVPLSFDTETRGLGGDLLFLTCCDLEGTHEFAGPDIVARFFKKMSRYPYPFVWFAHHAQYDWRYFLEHIARLNVPYKISMRTESDIYQIQLTLEGQTVVMRDSMAIYPGSLKDFAKGFCPELPKGDIDLANTTFDPSNPEHRAYARRDAEILRVGLPRFDAMMRKHFGVSLGHTTAGTGMKAWQKSLPDGVKFNPSKWGKREEFVRSAYYGGLVFLTTTKLHKAKGDEPAAVTFDINSSYPDKMCRYGVPWGAPTRTHDYESGLMGIYRVVVRAPSDLLIPILPRRNEKGFMRWSSGEFETTVTSTELQFAVAHGYEVLEIIEGLAFEDRIFPFNDVIEKCKAIRRDFKGSAEEILAKLIQNSIYGKFGSKRERAEIFQPEDDDETIGATPLDPAGYFWTRKTFNEDMRCLPEWAVFITAHARLHLIGQAYKVGPENCYYGDTDSLTVHPSVAHMFDSGNEYGQWKREKEWRTFKALAPKVYSGRLMDGRTCGAAKGLPKRQMNDQRWDALTDGKKIQVGYSTLDSLKVAMQRGVRPARDVSRVSTNIANSANWELNNGVVRPKMAS